MERTFLSIKFMVILVIMSLFSSVAMTRVGASPSTTKLYVDPSKVEQWTPAFGETFTINVSIANVTGLQLFEFKLYWNTAQLDLAKVDIQPFLNPPIGIYKNETIQDYNATHGRYWLFVISGATLPKTGSGTLATLSFKVMHCEPIRPENVTSVLDLAETELRDANIYPIPHDVYDGKYVCYSTPFLCITTMTDKPYYQLQEYGNITVYGNLTAGYSPVQDRLVALEVDDPRKQKFIIRTLPTGTSPASQIIEIVDVFPSDKWGFRLPKNDFYRGGLAWLTITLRNNDIERRRVLAVINVYDTEDKPFGISAREASVSAGTTVNWTLSFSIPDTAPVGEALGYANALNGWPKDGGTAYCPEKSATFNIISSTAAATTSTTIRSLTQSDGNYSLTFKLPRGATAGIYEAYASASYQGLSTMSSMAFGVNVIRVPDHYLTIQGAVNAASPTNNSILVLPGTYNEHVTINKPLTLVGREPGTTVINGGGTGTVVAVTTANVTVSRFKIRNGGTSFTDSGIALKNSNDSTISENILFKNYYGINIDSSDNIEISHNRLSSNNYGIYLNHSTGNILRNNDMICNKYNFGVFGDPVSDFIHNIDTSNTVDRKPVIYWIGRNDVEVPSNAGFVAIVSSTNIILRDVELTKNAQGVLLAYSNRNTIIGNTVSNNSVGIYLRNSNESNIYHNNFINNVNQVEGYQSSNTWDDGGIWLCPKCGQPQPKGNYWSDYKGLDDGTHTQAHNCPGDGVGDTLTPHLGVDKYPLMKPWILVYDIAITNVTYVIPYNATHVYPVEGWYVTVTVTIENKGDSNESFNVSAYANTILIQTQTVTLPIRNVRTIIFTWYMDEEVAKGIYTLTATATPVPGETNRVDNTYTDDTIRVNMLGDIRPEFGLVDIFDLVYVGLRYGSERGKPPPLHTLAYEAIADIVFDGIIDVFDLVKVGLNYRKTDC